MWNIFTQTCDQGRERNVTTYTVSKAIVFQRKFCTIPEKRIAKLIYDAVHQTPYSFKNDLGLLITQETPVLNALNILITSFLLSIFEQDVVRGMREQFLAHPDHNTPLFARPIDDYIRSPLTHALGRLVAVFTGDAREHGVDVPDLLEDEGDDAMDGALLI